MGKLYVISGDDEFARKQRTRELVLKLSELPADAEPEENPALEIVAGDSAELKAPAIAGRFIDALRTPPFLCDRKLLWMRHFPDLELLSAAKTETPLGAMAQMLAEELPPEVTVVLDGPGLDQRKSWAKQLKSAGAQILNCGTAKPNDRNYAENRRREIEDFFAAAGRRINADAVQFLCEAIGGDSGTLQNELEKLDCFVGNAPVVTLEHALAIVSRTPETLSWEFTSAVLAGTPARALHLLALLLKQRESGMELRILFSLAKEFQGMIQTRLAMKQLGVTRINPRMFDVVPDSVREANPGNLLLKMHPYRAFKVCEAAAGRSPAELAAKLAMVADANRKLVSGGGDPRIILEQLTMALAFRGTSMAR